MIKLQDAENGQYYFTLVADNGETVMTSKTYDRKDVGRDSAEAIADMNFEVGDFTKRKKPGPKPQERNGFPPEPTTEEVKSWLEG